MILKKIISLCKNNDYIAIYNAGDRQWISDGYAFFPLEGVPWFDTDELLAVFDVKGKKKEKIAKCNFANLPDTYCFDDVCDGEVRCVQHPMKINLDGRVYVQLLTSNGCEFLDNRYLEPLKDADENMLVIYERYDYDDGSSYFVVKDGLFIIGVIPPARFLNQATLEDLRLFVSRCEIHIKNTTE